MLRLHELDVAYGKIQALFGISLEVAAGDLVVILGNNGAGKSTILQCIAGLLQCTKGTIEYEGQRIERLSADKRVKLGLCLVPQGRQIFPGITLRDNLLLGAYTRSDRKEIERDIQKIFDLFPILSTRQSQKAGTLSGGEQQMLAIGRGLLSRPKMLLLDEPSIGLAPKLVELIYQIIAKLHGEERKTILLVEQIAMMALQISEFAYVIQSGRISIKGKPQQLMMNEDIKAAYLGYEIT